MFDLALSCLVPAYFNHRFIGLPTTIGVMNNALVMSFTIVGLDKMGMSTLRDYEVSLLSSIVFPDVLMQEMLSLLLFASALHVDLGSLRGCKWQVGLLAVLLFREAFRLPRGFRSWARGSPSGRSFGSLFCGKSFK